MNNIVLLVSVFTLLSLQLGGTHPVSNSSESQSSTSDCTQAAACPCGHERGVDGRDGREGAPGPRGAPGRDGRDGLVGSQGPPGPVTNIGEKGERGPRGPTGPVGLTGDTGPAGPPGRTGPVGPSGLAGDTGLTGPPGPPGPVGPAGDSAGPASRGVVYTRWGSSSCPDVSGTSLVYSGRVGGSYYAQDGGGANYLCMPPDPQYTLPYRSGAQTNTIANLYGAEYEQPIVTSSNQHSIPCAVCRATRESVLMIPAKTSCPTSWTEEYEGYLMTAYHSESKAMFECFDKSQEAIPGTGANVNGATVFHVEAVCTGLQCPPYDAHKELTCVVCTM